MLLSYINDMIQH